MSAPTHVIAEPGDKRSLCGVKNPLPHVAAKWVQMHIDGHGMLVCPACDALRPEPESRPELHVIPGEGIPDDTNFWDDEDDHYGWETEGPAS